MKNIWIMNHYITPLDIDRNHRHNKFAKYLTKNGCDLTLFHSNFSHEKSIFYYSNKELYNEVDTDYGKYISIKTREYKGNGIDRVFNMIDFYRGLKKVAPILVNKYGKPDIIYASSVHPLTLIAGIQIAKKLGIPCVSEVRDLWPESFVTYRILGKNNLFLKILYKLEKWIYENSDQLIFTMEGGRDYIIDKKWNKENGGKIDLNKVHSINNGIDLEVFNYNKENYRLSDDILLDDKYYKVIYTGSLRYANRQIWVLLETIKIMQDKKYEDIRFIIYGEGSEKIKIENYCKENNMKNVFIKGYVDYKYIPYILSCCDLNVLNCINKDIFKYGGSQNKLFDYLASGNPIISGQDEKYNIIKKYSCGISKTFNTPEDIRDSIMRVKNMSDLEKKVMKDNALNAVKEYDFKNLTKMLIDIFEECR